MEAVFRAAPTDFGNWLDRFSDGRDFGPWRRRRHIDGELCLNFAFVVFGIEKYFGDRRPVARLARPAAGVEPLGLFISLPI